MMTLKTVEDYLKQTIGELVIANAQLAAQIDALQVRITELTPPDPGPSAPHGAV